jgi:hypothetical protein
MKVFLAVSLILNVVLGVLFFQEKNQPPMERIVLEHSAHKETKTKIADVHKPPHKKAAMMVNTSDANTGEPPIIVQDESSFIQASEELTRAQNDFLMEELEMSEETLKKKVNLTNKFYDDTGTLYKQNPSGMRLSFKDRRKEIELEEKLHQDYAKLLGKRRWERYRNFVDDYNQKIIKNHKSREISPLMMGY